jgi:hypothetical protein
MPPKRGRPIQVETSKQRDAFDYYYTSGEKRSFRKTAQRFRVTERTIANWAKKFQWTERINDIDVEVYDRMDEKLVTSMVDVKTKLINSLIMILEEGLIQELKLGNVPVKIEKMGDIKMITDLIFSLAGPEPEDEGNKVPTELKGMNAKDKSDLQKLLKIVSGGYSTEEDGIEEHDDPEFKGDAPFELE